ncbi:beta-ketoacyl synthase N-terminal-like domain-containing protein [Streptomyces mauvecolor]
MATSPATAVIGMAVLLPGAPDLAAYWRNLIHGVDAITDMPERRWGASGGRPPGPAGVRRGGFVDGLATVDTARFGIMPSSVAGTEPDQLIALQVAADAIADAGGAERLPDRNRVGVVLGRGGYLTPGLARLDQRVRTVGQVVLTVRELLPQLDTMQLALLRHKLEGRLEPDRPEAAIGLVPNLAASRVANRLDLRGPAYTVDAACASSLVALRHAVDDLATGRCDVMLAGGVHHCHDVTLWSVFDRLGALSATHRIRPFHRSADGILIGKGTAVVVLKRLADAVREGDRVYAVIRGVGIASDGRAAALASPDSQGQARAVRAAWRAAGLDPSKAHSVGLLEAHGTATPAGDSAELATLAEVFGPAHAGARPVLGSVKSMIGHTMPTAGMAGLVKAALAVHHGVLPPTLHCEDPHPAVEATRFRTIGAAEPWPAEGATPRRAAVNAFGFGGINAHVVLEQAPEPEAAPRAPSARLTTATEIREPERVLRLANPTLEGLAATLDATDPKVHDLGEQRTTEPAAAFRIAVAGPTPQRLEVARRAVSLGRPWRGRNDIWFTPAPLLGTRGGKVAFLFPGLEGHFAPRIQDVADHFGLGLPDLDRGSARRSAAVGDIGRHSLEVVAVGRTLDSVLRRMRITPDALAGHSVGEWTAMIAAGCFEESAVDDFLHGFEAEGLRVPGVVFAALGADADTVTRMLQQAGGDHGMVLSHDNAPHQTVVCGERQAIEALVRTTRTTGIVAQILPFQSGFHTPMLAPYLTSVRQSLARFELRPPSAPLWSATTVAPYPRRADEIRALFLRHLVEPVRFRPMIRALHDAGARAFIQMGPGRLASLVGDTLDGLDHLALAANSPHRPGLAQLRRVAAALWVDGAEPDAGSLLASGGRTGGRDTTGHTPLDLTTPPIRLPSAALTELRPHAQAALGRSSRRMGDPPPRTRADRELEALLGETEQAAVAVRAAAARAATPVEQAPSTSVLPVSTERMPYLLDHCFFRQRADWPDQSDRWPVVPATTIIEHMADAARRAGPERRVTALHDLRFEQWASAATPVDVPITAQRTGPGRLAVAFGPYARGVVQLAQNYPELPRPWVVERLTGQPPGIVAADLYRDRWMFHGPAFQGISRIVSLDDTHVRGEITARTAPGSLLDNVGQLLGCWIMSRHADRTVVFPVGIRELRYYGPQPPPGTRVECTARITSLTPSTLEADVQLTVGGRVWAEISGWQDRRFDSHRDMTAATRFPERHTLSQVMPGDWVVLHERWPGPASRELVMRGHLGAAERIRYERQPVRGRRAWLLGRVAAKDAVRQWLWARGEGPVFPAEVEVGNEPSGRPYVRGVHGRTLPALDVSLAHTDGAAVALVRPASAALCGAGIDIETVGVRPELALAVALGETERKLLAACRADGDTEDLWFTRFWAAKEAVAKAEGTGLQGRPAAFQVVHARRDALLLTAPGCGPDRLHHVRFTTLGTPPDLPARTHVVAWTTGLVDHDR